MKNHQLVIHQVSNNIQSEYYVYLRNCVQKKFFLYVIVNTVFCYIQNICIDK